MKKALVISGGGSKGAFSVGVLKGLYKWAPSTSFDIFVGTSTGALIAPLAAMGEHEKLEKLYTSNKNKDIIKKFNFGDRVLSGASSIFSFSPLKNILADIYNDDFFNRLQQSGKEIYLTTVCLQTQELVVFTNAKNPKPGSYYKLRSLETGAQFRAAVLASASQPVFTPAVRIDENLPGAAHPNYQYVDGGVREYAGVMIAVEAGAENVFTIVHSTEIAVDSKKEFKVMFEILEQTLEMFLTDVGENDLYVPHLYNSGLQYIQRVRAKMKAAGISDEEIDDFFDVDANNPFQNKKPIRIHLIKPHEFLGGGPGGLNFDPKEMKEMLVMGEYAFDAYAASYDDEGSFWT